MTTDDLTNLNQKYGIRDQLIFTDGAGGLIVAEVRNPHGDATIALQGGHILSY